MPLHALVDAVHIGQQHKGAGAQFHPVCLTLGGQHFMDPLLAWACGLFGNVGLHALSCVCVCSLCNEAALIVGVRYVYQSMCFHAGGLCILKYAGRIQETYISFTELCKAGLLVFPIVMH
jgi:hypothetical protein